MRIKYVATIEGILETDENLEEELLNELIYNQIAEDLSFGDEFKNSIEIKTENLW